MKRRLSSELTSKEITDIRVQVMRTALAYEIKNGVDRNRPGRIAHELVMEEMGFVGTPEEVHAQLGAYIEARITP